MLDKIRDYVLYRGYYDETKAYIVEVHKDRASDLTDKQLKDLFKADEIIRV